MIGRRREGENFELKTEFPFALLIYGKSSLEVGAFDTRFSIRFQGLREREQ